MISLPICFFVQTHSSYHRIISLKLVFNIVPSFLLSGLSFLNIGSGTGYFSCLAGCILQAHGINHGIELYQDLVQFAKERVEEFLRFSPSVADDICPPKFLAGNCFRLDSSGCHYDRVYCGAACPASKVPFIVSLTKIGGFAVIPCRDKVRLFLYFPDHIFGNSTW